MAVNPITADNLATILALLSRSAGYDVGLADEIECLNEMGGFGFVATDGAQNPEAFARTYPIASDVWLVELFPRASARIGELVAALATEARVRHPGHAFRIDLRADEAALAGTVSALGFARHKNFWHYELVGRAKNSALAVGEKLVPARADHAVAFSAILADLHRYSPDEARRAIERGDCWVYEDTAGIARAAAKVRAAGDSGHYELVEFAVDPDQRGQGLGTRFLAALIDRLATERDRAASAFAMALKVESTRVAAQRCYERLGFKRNDSKSETWAYLDVSARSG